MIVGASVCEVGVAYVGIMSHLLTGLVNLCHVIGRLGRCLPQSPTTEVLYNRIVLAFDGSRRVPST